MEYPAFRTSNVINKHSNISVYAIVPQVMWSPANTTGPELLATTGDYLRLWGEDSEGNFELKALLNNNRHTGLKPDPLPLYDSFFPEVA